MLTNLYLDEVAEQVGRVFIMSESRNLTGYGAHAALFFDGNEEKYDLWECRFLSYMRTKKLKDAVNPDGPNVSPDMKEDAFAELVQHIDERSLSLIMRDARDDGRKALKILRSHSTRARESRVCCRCFVS